LVDIYFLGEYGQQVKALKLQEETLKQLRVKLGDDHPDTLDAKHKQANFLLIMKRHDAALAMLPDLVAGIEKFRAQPALTTEQRQSLFVRYSQLYQLYVTWYTENRRFAEAFNLGDMSKARTLADSIRAQSALRALPADDQAKLQASETRGGQLRAHLEKVGNEGKDTAVILAAQKEMEAHEEAHRKLLADLGQRHPKYAQLTTLKPATAEQARTLLGPDEAFVSYLITNFSAQVFVLDATGDPKWVDLGGLPNHESTVAAYRALVAQEKRQYRGKLVKLPEGGYQWLLPGEAMPKGAAPAGTRGFDQESEAEAGTASVTPIEEIEAARRELERYFHDKLIKPVLPLAGGKARWIVSPDKDLALLPFDTLPATMSESGVVKRLVETRNVTLVQSFAVYALLKQRAAEYANLQRPKPLLAVGNAVYGQGWAEGRGVARGGGTRSFTTREDPSAVRSGGPLNTAAEQYALTGLKWSNLPGTARELREVKAVFGGTDTLEGPQASEGNLLELNRQGKLQDYRYLLFSAHGYLAQNPALSSLVLSQEGNPPELDGYVTAGEWPLYDVKSDLTVLSACDTGVGRTLAGESVMGLPYALFVAGNRNTVLSLWPVDDEATAEFMKGFFGRLKAGQGQADALRETKRSFMSHTRWQASRYWAAFVLYGM
jgi:hypothetical protein